MQTTLFKTAACALLAGLGAAFAPLSSAATSSTAPGFLIYRVYLPAAGPSQIALPTLTYTYNDGRPTRVLKPCSGSSTSAISLSGLTSSCAWAFVVSGAKGSAGLNIEYPDTASTYWVTPFSADPALTITVSGSYPDARYMSFNVYDSGGNSFTNSAGMVSALADYLIGPDNGNLNPWQTSAPVGGKFTVQVSAAAAPGMSNTLPMPPSTPSSTIPGITPTCKTDCPDPNVFLRESLGSLFPNVDNAYIRALTNPSPGQVMVVRGKLPATVHGSHAAPWPAGAAQLRYFSICSNLYAFPYPVSSCVADDQIKVDGMGYYTIVVSSAADKPANTGSAYGVEWLENSAIAPYTRQMVLVRNMLDNQFPQAVQHVAKGSTAADTQTVMQAYYPLAWTCAKKVFESGGWQACSKQ